MIIKAISTQSIDFGNYGDNGGRPYATVNIDDIPTTYQAQYIKSLKRNKSAGLLDFKILEA